MIHPRFSYLLFISRIKSIRKVQHSTEFTVTYNIIFNSIDDYNNRHNQQQS